MTDTIHYETDLGGMAYPFLPTSWQWQINSYPFAKTDARQGTGPSTSAGQAPSTSSGPTLRWVKDNKVLDLVVPGMDTASFLAATGLELSLHKGGYVLSKRLSRVLRPFRYWGFAQATDITIYYDEHLDGALWDGCGLVSRRFIRELARSLKLEEAQRRELLTTNRFEVTTLHAAGQDKGHVLVSELADALDADFVFPAGSAKTELKLSNGMVFIGLHPVHSQDELRLDVQSLINLHPFFCPEQLLAWTQMESARFLRAIREDAWVMPGDLPAWHVAEYLACGGSLSWFAGMTQAVGRIHLKQLGQQHGKLRLPVPGGGRYYLFPAAVGGRDVPSGHVTLDPMTATAWVNDQDWLETLVPVLGGCDGDDAVWVLPLRDRDEGLAPQVLLWRSPNQVGEYVLLRPTAESHTIIWETAAGVPLSSPVMQTSLLPPRIDTTGPQYGMLPTTGSQSSSPTAYTTAAMASSIRQAAANQGVLGQFCNVALLCKAIYGRLPNQLPASLESVIDATVKEGRDLQPVRAWNEVALRRMVAHGQQVAARGVPQALVERLPESLQTGVVTATNHWLDILLEALENHVAAYSAEVEALAAAACPPLALFTQGQGWLTAGKELRVVYSQALRPLAMPDLTEAERETLFAEAAAASAAYLAQWPAAQQANVLLGAAAYLYLQGESGAPVRDGLLWQLGAKRAGGGREPGMAQQMLAALRQIGLLGEAVATTTGTVLHYQQTRRPAGVAARLNGVWANWLRVVDPTTPARMGDIPQARRAWAKERIADLVQARFRGLLLTTEVTDDLRLVARTAQGNLFGYVQRGQEMALLAHAQWQIAWATAEDGNVWALLTPAAA
ncbi:MAG: hypothetical protein R3E31_02865 [Chloroflexota bacterium]